MKKRIFFLLITMCVFLLPFSAYANTDELVVREIGSEAKDDNSAEADKGFSYYDDTIDLDAVCSMSLVFKHSRKPIADEAVELYKIASFAEDHTYLIEEDFAPTGINLNGELSKSELSTFRTTLDNFINTNNILPLKVNFTDDNGTVTFSGLETGLYFTSPVNTKRSGINYFFDSVLTSLPTVKDAKLIYDVDVNTKPYEVNAPSAASRYKIAKLWKDEGSEDIRPKSVTVDIYKDKVLYDTVVLNETNNWYHTWTVPSDGSEWSVAEKNAPDNYIPLVEERLMSFALINTEKNVGEPPESPDAPSISTGDTSNIGLYIIIMCVSGVLLIAVSCVGKMKLENEDV